jgi:hypothetical protein
LLSAEHGKVLGDAARRSGSRPREHRVRLRHPAPAEGRLQRAGVHRRRRLLDQAAPRRRGRHHAVQLPGDGADVDVRQRPRVRQHVRAQAQREGPVGGACSSPSCSSRRAFPTAASTWSTATRWPSTACSSTPTSQAVSFVGSTPIARYIYETGTKNGKRVQALGGAKNHMLVLPDADLDMAADAAVSAAYGSAGERCMAISRGAGQSTPSPTTWSPRSRLASPPSRWARPARMATRWARSSPASTATRWPATSPAPSRGRHGGGRRPRGCARRGLLPQAQPDRQREARACAATTTRSSARCSPSPASRLRRGLDLINANQFGNGTAIFTRDGGAARQFEFDVQVGMVGINVPIPVPVSYYSFGGWKASPVRRHAHVRPRRHQLLHPHQGGHLALARPAQQQDLGFGRPRIPAEPLTYRSTTLPLPHRRWQEQANGTGAHGR